MEGGDRVLEHSLIYAAIELNDAEAIRPMISEPDPVVRRAALIALDQLDGDDLHAEDVRSLLVSDDDQLNDVAWWIAEQHPDWGDAVKAAFDTELKLNPDDPETVHRLTKRLRRFSGSQQVQRMMADSLEANTTNHTLRLGLIGAMAGS